MGGFRAPVFGQMDGPLHGPGDASQWPDILGPQEPHNLAAWVREITAGRTPTWSPSATELRDFSRTANERALAEAITARQRSQERLAALQDLARTQPGGLFPDQSTALNVMDNNIKTLGDVIKQTSAQLEANGTITPRTIIPILSPDGTPSGFGANPFNPDGPTINMSHISPDQASQVSEGALNRAAREEQDRQANARNRASTGATLGAAQIHAGASDRIAAARLVVAQTAADTARMEANVKLRQAEMTLEGTDIKTRELYSKEISDMQEKVLHENANLLDRAFQDLTQADIAQVTQSVEWDKIGESARNVTQEAINKRVEAIQAEDIADYQGRVSQQNTRDKGVADLVGKMWDSYVGSLKDMSTVPEGWLNAVQKAGRTQAYARQIGGLMAMVEPMSPDIGKFDEFAQKARGLFGPLEQNNYRPLPGVAEEYQRLPPPDLSQTFGMNVDLAREAAAGRAVPMPDMPQNPLHAGGTYTPGDLARPRSPLTSVLDNFQAPIAEGMEPPPDEGPSIGSSMLNDLQNEPDPVSPPIDPTLFDETGYTAPFAGGDPQTDFELYRPLIENAPEQAMVPSLLNFMAGLNARDDVADDPERVLREEYDYAFGPFGSTYNLDPNDFGDLYSDNTYDTGLGFDFGQPDYGGIF